MPINIAGLPTTAFETSPQDDPQNVFFLEGTLLLADDGTAYRARDYRPGHDEVGQGDRVVRFGERQFLSIDRTDASHSVRREFTRQEIENLGIRVVWYPAEDEEKN